MLFNILSTDVGEFFDIFTDDKHSSEPTAIDLKSL